MTDVSKFEKKVDGGTDEEKQKRYTELLDSAAVLNTAMKTAGEAIGTIVRSVAAIRDETGEMMAHVYGEMQPGFLAVTFYEEPNCTGKITNQMYGDPNEIEAIMETIRENVANPECPYKSVWIIQRTAGIQEMITMKLN